jgi:hypothetical protein
MDYILAFAITFECIFCYDFFFKKLQGLNIWYIMEKYIWIEKNYNKNFNQQITMDFWMIEFEPYFQKFLSWSFFVGLTIFST